jgi:hypothetical protein
MRMECIAARAGSSCVQWDHDRNFMQAARLLYPDDYALTQTYPAKRGRKMARLRMQHRYEGWRLLTSLASLADSADLARKQIAAQGMNR